MHQESKVLKSRMLLHIVFAENSFLEIKSEFSDWNNIPLSDIEGLSLINMCRYLNSRYIEHGNWITCIIFGIYESDIRNYWCTGYAVTITRISRLYSQVLPRRILLMKCFPVLIIPQYNASSTHNTRKPQRNMQIILNLYTGLRTCSLRLIIRSLDFGNSHYQILIQVRIHSFIQPIATG